MPGPAAPEPMSEPNPTHGSPAASSSELQINIDQSERDTLMSQGYQTYPRAQELDTLHKKVNDLEMEKTLLAEENQRAKMLYDKVSAALKTATEKNTFSEVKIRKLQSDLDLHKKQNERLKNKVTAMENKEAEEKSDGMVETYHQIAKLTEQVQSLRTENAHLMENKTTAEEYAANTLNNQMIFNAHAECDRRLEETSETIKKAILGHQELLIDLANKVDLMKNAEKSKSDKKRVLEDIQDKLSEIIQNRCAPPKPKNLTENQFSYYMNMMAMFCETRENLIDEKVMTAIKVLDKIAKKLGELNVESLPDLDTSLHKLLTETVENIGDLTASLDPIRDFEARKMSFLTKTNVRSMFSMWSLGEHIELIKLTYLAKVAPELQDEIVRDIQNGDHLKIYSGEILNMPKLGEAINIQSYREFKKRKHLCREEVEAISMGSNNAMSSAAIYCLEDIKMERNEAETESE